MFSPGKTVAWSVYGLGETLAGRRQRDDMAVTRRPFSG